MSTVAPLDFERLLLEGAEAAERKYPRLNITPQPPGGPKPDLEDALLAHYNRNRSPEQRLKPGQLPPQAEQPYEPPGFMSRVTGAVGEAVGNPPGITTTQTPTIVSPMGTGDTTRAIEPTTPDPRLYTSKQELHQRRLAELPSRSKGLIGDLGEAAYTITRDVAGAGFGALTAVSDILNAQMARIARGGPMAGGPESPTHYRDIFKEMNKTISSVRYEPESDVAKMAQKAVGGAAGIVSDLSELVTKPIAYLTGLDEDRAKVLSYAIELWAFSKLDAGVRKATSGVRSKLSDFSDRMGKMKSDADYTSSGAERAAQDLYTTVNRNPEAQRVLTEARQKLIGEAGKPGGEPSGPTGEGPAPGGAKVDPAELQAYKDTLRTRADELRKQGAGPTRIQNELNAIPKPQPRQAPEAPTTERPTQPEVVVGQETALAPRAPEAPRPTAEPTRPTPEPIRPPRANLSAHPLYLQNNIDNQVAMADRWGITDDVIRLASEGNVAADITKSVRAKVPTSISDADLRSTVRAIRTAYAIPNMDEVRAGEGVLPTAPTAAPVAPTPEPTQPAAATVAPETVPAPVSPGPATVAAVTPTTQNLRSTLTNATRNPRIGGEVIISADPIAQDILKSKDFSNLESTLGKPEIRGILGAGTRSIVLEMADGRALRLGLGEDLPWPGIPEVIRPEAFGAQGNLRWQIMPRLETNNITESDVLSMTETLKAKGYLFNDPGSDNLGRTPDGKIVVIDPGAVTKMPTEYRNYSLEDIEALARNPTKQNLSVLKSLVSKVSEGKGLDVGLERLGFTETEIEQLKKELRKIRAKKAGTETLQQVAEQPAVQTAATEAVLENAPAGTEVEIPAPSEPVIDTTPVIDKPKRKRRIVKAAEPELPTLTDEQRADLYASGQTQRAPAGSIPAGVTTPDTRYYNVRGVNMLKDFVGSTPEINGGTTLPRAPIQVRAKPGAKPDAVFIDTTGLSTRTKLSDIDVQQERGRMSEETATALRDNLRRQAELSGKLLEEAHTFTGQELLREATRIAAETGVDLYVRKGKNYELVPKDVVRTDARLNSGDDLKPVPISREAAGAYAESKTSPIGPDTIREIENAIETGVDISDKLPAELLPHYREMRARERDGIDTSERRAFMDILSDFNTLLGERGAFGGNWSREQRMAAQRLQADIRKKGKNVREFLFGARPEDVAVFERYLERINNPPPVDSTNPRNMRFDPTIPKNRNDRVVKHRKVSGEFDLDAVPLWRSEVEGIQNARDIKAGGTPWDLKLPLRQHKAAGTEFIYYGYRTAQKNKNAALNDLHADMQELGRGFSSASLEAIGAAGYKRQGGDGQRILTYNKVTPRALTPAERRLQAAIYSIYEATFLQLQESRRITGRPPLQHIDDYQTFARTIGLLNHLGIKVDLARDDPAMINEMYIKHRATNFPYVVRKHAFYTAEFNALKILDRYMQSALSDIHLSPFLAKVHELIETRLPDPTTGEETWMLKDNKPGLYNELRRWTDYLSTGTNIQIPDKIRTILTTLNSNIAYATLSGLIRSGGIQISTLVNTQHALGPMNTAKAVVDNLVDHIPYLGGGKQKQFALDNSEILSSRKFIDAYNEVASAIIGRRPRDFFHAIRTGDLGAIQQTFGRPGFKLMELTDMEAAVIAWNGAYKQAKNKLGYNHKESIRYADDLVVRTQGSTMPGDLAGAQRNAAGKLITQFQTFLISDWNFLTHEVLSKGKPGGGGGGQIPPGGVASGSGNWDVPGSRSTFQLVKNVVGFLIATQLMNEFFKLLHLQPAQPDPLKDIQQGLSAGHGPIGLAFDLAVGQAERMPVYGGALRYGKGVTGPATETARDLVRASRGDPLVRNPYETFYKETFGMPKGEAQLASRMTEPLGTMLGIPYSRQISKTAMGLRRGESVYDSLMGWYSEGRSSGRRERGERRERRSQ